MSSIIAGITKDLKAVPENLKAKAKGADAKKLLLLNVPYILAGYFCDKVAWLWRVSEGADASAKMIAAMNGFDTLFSNPLPSFHPRDLLIGAGCGIALRLVVYYKAKNAKKFRHGKEYGSARWGNGRTVTRFYGAFSICGRYAATACRDDRRAAGCQGAALTVAGKPAQNGHREPCG